MFYIDREDVSIVIWKSGFLVHEFFPDSTTLLFILTVDKIKSFMI